MSLNPNEIVEATRLPGFKSVFALGLFGRKITIHSQQLRAFNLADALAKEGIVAATSKVAVIGGGIAGLSMAAALALRTACGIHIYESAENLLRLQRGNKTRFLHPTVYDWPRKGSTTPYTYLPALDWSAGPSHEVAATIWRQFLEIDHPFEVHAGKTAQAPVETGGRCVVICKETPTLKESFDVVVVCIGFGRERGLFGEPALSYWDMDNFETFHWHDEHFPQTLVVGAGDGGLIDAIRMAVVDFDQGDITQEIINLGNVATWAGALERDEQALRDRLAGAELIAALNHLYLDKEPPARLMRTLRAHRRTGAVVNLTDVTGSAFGPNASLMNKVLVSGLIQDKVIRWRDPATIPLPPAGLDKSQLEKAALDFDLWRRAEGIGLVVERIGTDKPLPPFLGLRELVVDARFQSADRLIGTEQFFDHLAFTTISRDRPVPQFAIMIVTTGAESPDIIPGGGSRETNIAMQAQLGRLEVNQRYSIALSSLPLDPALTRDHDNISLINERIESINPSCIIFMGSDIARLAPQVHFGDRKIVIFSEGRMAGAIQAQLGTTPASANVFYRTQSVNLAELCHVIDRAIPGKTLGFIFNDDYPVDRMFADSLQAAWGLEHAAGRVSFTLAPVVLTQDRIDIAALPPFEVYCGRVYVQLKGGASLMRKVPYISGFSQDISHGAIAAADTDYNYISDEIVDGLVRPILAAEPPTEPDKDITQRLYFASRSNAARLNVTIGEPFFRLPIRHR